MNTDDILIEHLNLCEETYQLISEENRSLKSEGRLSYGFLERKREHLTRLDRSLEALKRLNSIPMAKTSETNKLIDKAQKRLMQIFLIDRENERLLNSHANTSGATPRASAIRKPNPVVYTQDNAHAQQASFGAEDRSVPSTYSDNEYTAEENAQRQIEGLSLQSFIKDTPADIPQKRLHRAYRQHIEANVGLAEEFSEKHQL